MKKSFLSGFYAGLGKSKVKAEKVFTIAIITDALYPVFAKKIVGFKLVSVSEPKDAVGYSFDGYIINSFPDNFNDVLYAVTSRMHGKLVAEDYENKDYEKRIAHGVMAFFAVLFTYILIYFLCQILSR